MISTATEAASARTKLPSPAAKNQTVNVIAAITITIGTNTLLMRSARRCTGARVPCASRIILTMRASTLLAPSVVALKRNAPVRLMVPPVTLSPAFFVTGIGSPVSIDSSTLLEPFVTAPSTGMRSPGRTMTMSPLTSSPIGTSSSWRLRSTRAVRGWRSMRRRIAPAVSPFARASSALPTRISAMMMITAS